MVLLIDHDREELIRLFMSEASNKKQLQNGLAKHQYPQHYIEAIGLVEVCVAFEAFMNVLDTEEPSIWKKRKLFSEMYQDLFESIYKELKNEITALIEELKKESLKDMTPKPRTREPIEAADNPNLEWITQVIYRVRSNLVHGNKSVNSSRNKTLISNSFYLLYKIMDAILRKEKIIT